jgi:glycosyltransferase involved in cell wall biosynthesis
VNILFLTNNPNLCSTSRILQYWLCLGRQEDLTGSVVLQQEGSLAHWLQTHQFSHIIDPMPWFDRKRPWSTIWHAMRVAAWARKQNIDLIHCNEHDVYPFAIWVRYFLRKPIVCHVRFRIQSSFADWAFGGKKRPDRLLWTSWQQKKDSDAAVAKHVPQEFQHIVYLGIDLSQFGNNPESGPFFRQKHGILDDEILISTASPLRPRKKVEDFVELIKRLAESYPRVVGIIAGGEIAGDEAYRRQIEVQIKESGLGRRLRWLGNLEPVEPLHAATDISVSTSEYETFGNSVCEAMACSAPVIGYRGGSVAEVVGDTGLIVENGDIGGLTNAAKILIEQPEQRQAYGQRARQRVQEQFNPGASFQKLLGIYDELLN